MGMRLRTLRIWKRLKPLWLLLAGWAVISAVMLLLWGYHMLDLRAGLPRVDVAASRTIDAEPVQEVHILAEGATVEVGASYDVREITVQLYGPGYVNQKASWTLDEKGALTIQLDRYPILGNAYGGRYEDDLTMRVLLPKKSYHELSVTGQRLHAALYGCKAMNLTADVAYGNILVQKADVQRAKLAANTSDINIVRSRIHQLAVNNRSGNTTLYDNRVRVWTYAAQSGNLEVLTGRLDGIWELESEDGDIHVGTRRWNRNLLLDLHTDTGLLEVQCKKKPWKKTIPAAISEQNLQLLEGRGEHMLLITSKTGDIHLDTIRLAQ